MGKYFTPVPVLKTERLTIRQLTSSDDQEIFALRSDDNVNKYLTRKPSKTLDDARSFIQAVEKNIRKNESIYWAITLNSTDKIVGKICLYCFLDDS